MAESLLLGFFKRGDDVERPPNDILDIELLLEGLDDPLADVLGQTVGRSHYGERVCLVLLVWVLPGGLVDHRRREVDKTFDSLVAVLEEVDGDQIVIGDDIGGLFVETDHSIDEGGKMIDAIEAVRVIQLFDGRGLAQVARVKFITTFPLNLAVTREVIHADEGVAVLKETRDDHLGERTFATCDEDFH
jgi:hypothetical protein